MLTRDQALAQMKPPLVDLAMQYEGKMDKAGLKFGYTSVARHYKEQIALFAQGRENFVQLSAYRLMAKMPTLTWTPQTIATYNKIVTTSPGKNAYVVTWTLNSKHIINLDDSDPTNNLSGAFDIVLIGANGRTPHYDVKVSVNKNKIPDYQEAAQIGATCFIVDGTTKYVLDPGGLWLKSPDLPHYQLKIITKAA